MIINVIFLWPSQFSLLESFYKAISKVMTPFLKFNHLVNKYLSCQIFFEGMQWTRQARTSLGDAHVPERWMDRVVRKIKKEINIFIKQNILR